MLRDPVRGHRPARDAPLIPLVWALACSPSAPPPPPEPEVAPRITPRPPPLRPLPAIQPQDPARFAFAADGLGILDLGIGAGPEAVAGTVAVLEITAWTANGAMWDSTRERAQPTRFVVGAGQVVEGWDRGVVGMRVGGVRQLIVPPEIGFPHGVGGRLPPGEPCTVQLELVDVLVPPIAPSAGPGSVVGGFAVEDVRVGLGEPLVAGVIAQIDYVGWTAAGQEFDTTFRRPAPFAFRYGHGQLRWEAAFEGMRVGGRRQIVIPADQAFGAEGRGEILPPDSALVLSVDLREVHPDPRVPGSIE